MRRIALILVAALGSLAAVPANALCYHRGQFNVRTTIDQEFRESDFVVSATVLSARNMDLGENGWGTVYRLRIDRVWRGRPARFISFTTRRNSGGFYLDRGTRPDIGGRYLLFLNRLGAWADGRAGERPDWTIVNYNCGKSDRWNAVSASDRRRLETLARRT